jgi:hypothetical protein
VAEHARRFPEGRLGEEREALRVRALAAAGLGAQAKAAGAAFRRRFPRSVHLPALEAVVGPAPPLDADGGDSALRPEADREADR